MTEQQCTALLALPNNEALVGQHCNLDAAGLAAMESARTPATQLGCDPKLFEFF